MLLQNEAEILNSTLEAVELKPFYGYTMNEYSLKNSGSHF